MTGTPNSRTNARRDGERSGERPERPASPSTTVGDRPGGPVPKSLRRLTCVGITHRSHSTAAVARVAPDDPLAVADRIAGNDRVTEVVVLSTCNRVEAYVSTRRPDSDDREAALAAVRDELDLGPDPRTREGLAVARHLARVAAGLESAVLGEDQIAGQVADALAAAKEAGLAGGALGRVGDAAIRAGRRCRAETAIDDGPAGYESAICRAIRRELDGSPDRVVVVGAGEMAETTVRAVTDRWSARVDVVNRSPARELATTDGRWWPLPALEDALGAADAVVTATGAPDPVVERSHAERLDPGTPVVDLATPPDVAPEAEDHPNVSLTDLDALARAVRETETRRREAVPAAESVIADAIDRLVATERENRAEDVLRALHREAASVRQAELERARDRLADGDADVETVLADFASSLTGSLLGTPTRKLRTAARERDETTIRAARRLFDLDLDETPDGGDRR